MTGHGDLEAAFLTALARHGIVARAAREAAVTRETVYYWRRTRPGFRRRLQEARLVALRESLHTC